MAFRNLRLSFPETEHGAVDCIVSLGSCHLRCQCKTAFQIQGRSGFRAALTRDRSGAQPVPYQVGDFDMLIVHVPNDPSRKFFIPAHELKNRGFLTDDFCKGKKSITVYMNDTHWTAAFLRHESCTGNPLSIGAHDKFVEIKSSQVDSIENKIPSSDSAKDTRLHKAPQIGRNPEEAQLPNCQVDCSEERVNVRCPSIAAESHYRCKKKCCTARKCPGGDQTNQIAHCCRLKAMRWQSETAFTESIHTLPCACSIIPISCDPNGTSLPWQRVHPACIFRRQMAQRCTLPPACSKQRDACTNIERAVPQPIHPIVPLNCCVLTGILASTRHPVKCAAAAKRGPVRNHTHQNPRYHKLLALMPNKIAGEICTRDMSRQRCIATELRRAQEVPLGPQRTHPSISRLMKPTDVLPLLSCKQNFRCIWNAATMCTCASLCAFSCISCPLHLNASHLTLHHIYRFFMCRQIGSIHMPHACWHKQSLACPLLRNNVMSPHECFHHPRSSLPIAHHLSVKIASHPTTKGMTHKSAHACIHYQVLAHEDFDSLNTEPDGSHDDLVSALIASATSAASIFAKRLLKHHPDYCS